MSHTPVYRTYLLQSPANAGKLAVMVDWVRLWRELATLERDYQIAHFRSTRGKAGLDNKVTAGWTRPWIQDGRCSVTMAQQVMSQVCAQLKGHLGILKNAVQALVGEQAKVQGWDANERHRLYSVNRHGLWLGRKGVKSPIKGEACVPAATLKTTRRLMVQALRQHAMPSFDRYHPQLDQRNGQIGFAGESKRKKNTDQVGETKPTTPKFPLWARVSPAGAGQPICLPLVGYADFMATLAQTSAALAPGQTERWTLKQQRRSAKREREGKPPANHKHQHGPLDARRAALPHTLRLILDEATAPPGAPSEPSGAVAGFARCRKDSPTLKVAIVLDHSAHDQLLRADYVPVPGKTVAFDLGLNILLASSEGDLLGRAWGEQLERYARVIDSIAAHRQRLGLPVRSARYDAWTRKLDGFIKTEIHRIVYRFVDRVRPERIIVADDSWDRSPNLSRRMNRLASRFGKRQLKVALAKLEATHGIVIETHPGAYTSKECASCGYVDARNRKDRDTFVCKCCGHKSHADVNAAKVSRERRSSPAMEAPWPHARHILRESVKRFVKRNPRPEVLEHRPIGRADDPRWSNPYFKAWQQHWTPHIERAEVKDTWRKPGTKTSIAVSSTRKGPLEGPVASVSQF